MSASVDPSQDPIEVNGLTRRFGSKVALNNVSLSVPKGCVFGLLGENGAGKTTLIKHLLGLLKPQSGSVAVCGFNPVKQPEQALSRIGYVSEDRDIPSWMSIEELMRYTQGLYPKWDDAFARDLCAKFELDPAQKVRTLSRGQLAKASLLVALAHSPELLVLDEPSSGLDVVVRRHILDTMMRTVAAEGRTILFSSHLMDEVETVSDYVAIIHKGNVLECDRLQAVTENHHRVVLRFPQPVTAPPEIDGAIHCSGIGTDWTVICNGDMDKVRASAAKLDAAIAEESSASLEDVFVARVGTTIPQHEDA